jgi:uncharacterized Zn-finger protein
MHRLSEADNPLCACAYHGTQFPWPIGSQVAQVPAEPKSHNCDFSGCEKSFKRKGDLTKHKKKHDYPEHHCPYNLCKRSFPDGFHHKDKLVDHLVAMHKHVKEEARQLAKTSGRSSHESLAGGVTVSSQQDWYSVASIGLSY